MKIHYVPLALVAINLVFFVLQSAVNGLTESLVLVSSDAAERPWTLLTSMFLHGDLFHLLGNMFALFLFGMILENVIGSRKFTLLYFASGIVAGSASILIYDSTLGASGAIFGILGALAVLRPKMMVWTYGVPMPMIAAAGFWLVLDILGAFYPTNIANMAHIAGLIFGVIAGLTVLRRYREKNPEPVPRKNAIDEEEFEKWEEEWV